MIFSLAPPTQIDMLKKIENDSHRGIRNKEGFVGKRREDNLEEELNFFFPFFLSTVIKCRMTIFWVDTDEPIFPYIPAICCGVSPVL